MEKLIYDLSLSDLEVWCEEHGEKSFRAKQIFEWIYRGVESFDEMSNVNKALREKLAADFTFAGVTLVSHSGSEEDGSEKLLVALSDGNMIESVLMFHDYGISLCVSTQVGCKMRCAFCATGMDGFIRNLSAGEIVAQVIMANKLLKSRGKTNVARLVYMGSGEPFDNYDNTIRSIRLLHQPEGLNIGYRNFTLSTSGLVDGIYNLTQEDLPLNLSISLHAPNDELRRQLLPIAKRYTIQEVLDAAMNYFDDSGRRVTIEYILISEVNDTTENAKELASLLKRLPFHVDLIPFNEVRGLDFKRPGYSRIKVFMDILKERGVNATCRFSKGKDINAACGQLKRHYSEARNIQNKPAPKANTKK